jgi:hypothetical protein
MMRHPTLWPDIACDSGQSLAIAEANFSEALRTLSPDQLLVIDELINARAVAARTIGQSTTEMQQAIRERDLAAFRQANRHATDALEQCRAYTVAIRVALNAFSNKRIHQAQRPGDLPVIASARR